MRRVITLLLVMMFDISVARGQEPLTLDTLKAQLARLQAQILRLEQQQQQQKKWLEQSLSKKTESAQTAIATPEPRTVNNTFRAYATIRPTWGYIQQQDEGTTDVRDALSHLGFKASRKIKSGWTAEMQGEWGIDLSNSGNFGKSRRAYVALDSPYGRVGIGKQRPPQYLMIAEYVDIFNHAASPFSYDPQSLFFVDNLLTYSKKSGDFTWMAAGKFDGQKGDAHNDLFNAGLSYDREQLHLALTYLSEDQLDRGGLAGRDKVLGGAGAYTFGNGVYLAIGYQNREYRPDHSAETTGHTLDISSAYPINDHYRVKLGYFDFDDGINNPSSQTFNGVNATMEWLPAPGLRFHLEYLNKDFEQLERFWSWSVGFRYDLSRQWEF